jgi:SAM-dependent methyltransferase
MSGEQKQAIFSGMLEEGAPPLRAGGGHAMPATAVPAEGSAPFQSVLWSITSRDWTDYQEPLLAPWYEAVLDHAHVGQGSRVLDVGCGAGLFVQMAAQRGAVVSGLDATPEFITIARDRTPGADLRVGEMEALPYDNRAFDLVTGFNSFQFAANPVHALQEARRVTRLAGRVVVGVFGPEQACDMAAPLAAFGKLMPPPPPGTQGPFALSQAGALEGLVRKAGLEPLAVEDVDVPFDLADEASALRCLLGSGPAIIAMRTSGAEHVHKAVLDAIAPFKTSSGAYRLNNKFRYLIAQRRESSL